MMTLFNAEVNGRLYVILLNGDGREGLAIDCGWAVEPDQIELFSDSGATAKIFGRTIGEAELLGFFQNRLLGLSAASVAGRTDVLPEIIRRIECLYVVLRDDDGADDYAAGLGIVFPLAQVEEIGGDWQEVPRLYGYSKTFARQRLGIQEMAMRCFAGPFDVYAFDGRSELLISYDPEGGREFNLLVTEDTGFRDSQVLTEVSSSLGEAPDRAHYLSPGSYLFVM